MHKKTLIATVLSLSVLALGFESAISRKPASHPAPISPPQTAPVAATASVIPPPVTTSAVLAAAVPPSPFIAPPPIEPPFVSSDVVMDAAPGVLDLEVGGGPGGQDSHVRGVALAGNGLLLTLADRIPVGAQIVSVTFEGRPIICQGWLARDPVNNWLIVKTTLAVPTRPAQVVAGQYLKLGAHELLAIPAVDGATVPVHGRTVKPTAGPDGTPLDPNAPLFWITGPSDLLVPGSPVYNRHGHLVGLIDQVRLDKALAQVRKVIAPFPIFDAAVDQEDGIGFSQSAPPGFNLEPFKDSAISPEVSQAITQSLSGETLRKACDQLLLQHGNSANAWYLASLGYARAGQDDRALSSAQMLTQIAPKAWQSWYLYARQQEGAKQFGAALDAYQNASEHNGPIRLLGLPIATCLFKAGDASAGLDYCKNLTNIDDHLFAAWMLQGDAQRAQNLLPDAVKSYTQAVEINPQSVRAWEALAAVCDQLHSASGSIESYIQLTLLVPDEPDIWYNLGLAFLRVHKLDAAQKSFEKVVELRPEDHVAQEQLTRVAEIEKAVPASVR